MADIVANLVAESATCTGTSGTYNGAGALNGHKRWSAEMAVNDRALFIARQVNSTTGAPTSGGAWEVFRGTYSATNQLTRSLVIDSSASGAAVNWAGSETIYVSMVDRAQVAPRGGDRVLAVSVGANQNDYNPTNWNELVDSLRVQATATMKLTGLVATMDGHLVTIANASTDFLLWLEHQAPASAAANRFDLPNGFPFWLMPGDRITLRYSEISARWQAISASSDLSKMGLTEFTDFAGGIVGPFTSTVSGTGAATAQSTYLVNTTERPMGVMQGTTGTTATGRATIGHAGTDSIVPTLGPALSVARVAQQQANSGTETYQLISGFADSAGGTFTDGVAWNLRWNSTAQEWSQDRLANAVATRSVTNSPTPNNNYLWCVVFCNPGWTRADFIFSTDSVSFTLADSPTTGLPGSARNTAWVGASMIKSVGTTARLFAADLAGYRVDYVRG